MGENLQPSSGLRLCYELKRSAPYFPAPIHYKEDRPFPFPNQCKFHLKTSTAASIPLSAEEPQSYTLGTATTKPFLGTTLALSPPKHLHAHFNV